MGGFESDLQLFFVRLRLAEVNRHLSQSRLQIAHFFRLRLARGFHLLQHRRMRRRDWGAGRKESVGEGRQGGWLNGWVWVGG